MDRYHLFKVIKNNLVNGEMVFNISRDITYASDIIKIGDFADFLGYESKHVNPSQPQKMRDDLPVQMLNP